MTDSNGVTYTYDALGQRIRKDGSVSPNEYIHIGGQVLAMYNPSTATWTDRIYGPMGALATVPGTQTGSPVYRATDHLGSLSYTLDSAGNIIGASSTLPYGQLTASTNDAFPFTDHERDSENRTDATKYRHYASFQGRWLSPDPSNGSYNLIDPQSLNRYAYLANRPTAQVDRQGLDGSLTYYTGGGDNGNDDDNSSSGDDGNWFTDDIWDPIENFFSGLFGGGGGGPRHGGGSQQAPPPASDVPTVASDGLAATTQPNGGATWISATLWAYPGAGASGWASMDASSGLDADGQNEISNPNI